jgi:hypothetical protein
VSELEFDLPGTAIGKDYLGSSIIGAAPSGSGVQLSFGGVLGLAVNVVDGLEFNVLGLNFGISPNGVKLPMVGRVGINLGSSTPPPQSMPSGPFADPGRLAGSAADEPIGGPSYRNTRTSVERCCQTRTDATMASCKGALPWLVA